MELGMRQDNCPPRNGGRGELCSQPAALAGQSTLWVRYGAWDNAMSGWSEVKRGRLCGPLEIGQRWSGKEIAANGLFES